MKTQFQRPVAILSVVAVTCLGGLLAASVASAGGGKVKVVPPPLFSISVNGGVDVDVYRGWPLLVRAQIFHSGIMQTNRVKRLKIAATVPPWSNVLQAEIKNSQGERQEWPLHLANAPLKALRLDARTGGETGWWVFPEETAAISVGTYQIVGVLNTANTRSKWKGVMRSVPVTVRILDEPVLLSAELETEKFLRLANYEVWRGNPVQAMELIDDLLARQPNNIAALSFKGDLLVAAGQLQDALGFYDQAIETVFADNPDPPEPPAELLRKRHAVQNQLLGLK